MYTSVDLRLKYKSDTGLSPIASYRTKSDSWNSERGIMGGYPLAAYGLWLEEQIHWIPNNMRLREIYVKETGYSPTYQHMFSTLCYSYGRPNSLRPEYTVWLEDHLIWATDMENKIIKYDINNA